MSSDRSQKITILHYSAPPVIGGVEAVIKAHLGLFIQAGYQTKVIAGRGDAAALPPETEFISIPEIDSNHPQILKINQRLEVGEVPPEFEEMESRLLDRLRPELADSDHTIIHNIFTKHFNLPLTSSLANLIADGGVQHPVCWSHDFTWTSPHSRNKVHPGYPWDLLRTKQPACDYVVVSQERQVALAELFGCSLDDIRVIYNGVAPDTLLGLSAEGKQLAHRLDLRHRDLILLMPVRVTQAKNIEFALETLAELKKNYSSPLLVVTGPPDPHDSLSMEYYQSLQELRNKLGLDENMRFIFETGPDLSQPYYLDERMVGELFRLSDVMFMPSHREGFGMPVLEAGLAGIPVVSRAVPAAVELAGSEATIIDQDCTPAQAAAAIIDKVEAAPAARFKRKVRREYTWQAIFEEQIEPLLHGTVKP